MGITLDLIDKKWYPAWDAGEKERFVTVTREIFAPDCQIDTGRAKFTGIEDALPLWVEHLEAFRPQVHNILWVVENGDNEVAIEYYWAGTHSGSFHMTDGLLVQPTGRRAEHTRAAIFVKSDGQRITKFHGHTDRGVYPKQLGQDQPAASRTS